MEVVALNSNNAPFKREVHEWQHIDSKTGSLLSGRAEANRYVNGNINTYGKSLLQSFESSDGTQHNQHKQMNILQTITSTGGALQVVRAQTIQTSHSSSSRRAITSTTYSHYNNNNNINNSTTATATATKMINNGGDLLSINPRTLHHHHEIEQQQQRHSPTSSSSSRLMALLSSSSSSSSSSSNYNPHNTSTATTTVSTAAATTSSEGISNRVFKTSYNDDMDQAMMMKNGVGSMKEFSRQQQINEMLFGSATTTTASKESTHGGSNFLRGKSASIEELANINDGDDDDVDLKPYDWKRVSKIRRSLQFPKTSERRINNTRPSRPVDLPENSVNVWKLRQDIEEIENGRRLNTAMKNTTNNHQQHNNNNNNIADFVALDTILKDSSPMDSLNFNHNGCIDRTNDYAKDDFKTDCVTAESLQEIRKRLRKLNVLNNTGLISPILTADENTNMNDNSQLQKLSLEHGCKSLELRKNKERDLNADDWLNRRKSYGFEKMQQPSEKSSLVGGIESSTDSGLGRSSENWSPTTVDLPPQRTIITFGDSKVKPATTSISLFSNPHQFKVKASEVIGSDKPIPMRRRSLERKEELKRHSIAIDERVDEHYQQRNGGADRKISLVNLNGPYVGDKLIPSSNLAIANDGRQKKVEFCKTEIHFAADSGRVNIVETDGKPPPTNNFRRRSRKNSGPTLIDSDSTLQQQQQLHSSDDIGKSIDARFDAIESNVTTSIGSILSNCGNQGKIFEYDTDEGHSDNEGLRGILKNKPIKPIPYHLGENLDSGSSLWGVRLKPIENQHTTWRHSADLESVLNAKKSDAEDALEVEFKNLVNSMDEEKQNHNNNNHYQSTTVSSDGYSTKINLSSLPATVQQQQQQQHHPANKDSSSSSSSSPLISASTAHKPLASTFTSYNDSRQSSRNIISSDKNQHKGHKISIDLKLPHPSSMDTIMDELKSTSLIIKTMKSTSYFDDAMRHLEQEKPLIRTSSLRLNNESLPKSSSTSMMFRNHQNHKSNAPVRYTSSLDGDCGILDGDDRRNVDDFGFLNGFLEENRKFQISIAQKEKEKNRFSHSPSSTSSPPVAAPRLKKIMNPSQQLSQQLSQLKHLYDIANDSDDNANDEEVKSFLSKNEEEKSISELSGSWSRVRVKKIASAFQSSSSSSAITTGDKWAKTAPLTSLYENSTVTTTETEETSKPLIEPTPRTSMIQIGSNHEKVNSGNIYSNVNSIQQDNSVKVNIQNFESLSPALSRNNSLRIKRDAVTKEETPKLSTGTRQLKAHELTYFGVKSSSSTTTNTTDTNIMITNRSPSMQLSNNINKNFSSPSLIKSNHHNNNNHNHTTNNSSTKSMSSKVIINNQKPDLIMHHHHQQQQQPLPVSELTSSEKKSFMEALDSCIDETKNLEPLYENLYQNNSSSSSRQQQYDRKLDLARDEKILDELTRAADEIMNTCKEMYQHDSEEKKRKSLMLSSNSVACLETIKEGTGMVNELEQPKVMKSKGVQVSRNFEDSLRRYHRTQQRTSSQSSIESLPRNSKTSTSSSTPATTRTKRTRNEIESTSTSATISSAARKRENGNGSDGSKRIQRVCSRERMYKSNASSSESDLPNSSIIEAPRRPRRTKIIKHHRDESIKVEEKKSSRVIDASSATRKSSSKLEHATVNKETRVRSSSSNPNTLTSSSHHNNNNNINGGITTSSSKKNRRIKVNVPKI